MGEAGACVLEPDPGAGEQVLAVEGLVELEKATSASGAVGSGDAADKRRLWLAGVPGHYVEHPVHPIDEVHVDAARLAEHHLGARCAALGCVAGAIIGAAVRFGFGDLEALHRAVGELPADEKAEEIGGDNEDVPGKKGLRDSRHRV